MFKFLSSGLVGWIADIVGALLLGVGIYCFAESIEIAPGGVSGIAIMIKHVTGLPVGLVSLVVNIPLLMFAYRFIGKNFALRTVRTVVINTFVLDVVVAEFIPQYTGDAAVGAVFAGVCMGAGVGIIFMSGSSTGGTDIVSLYMEKRFPYVQLGQALMIIDCVVLATSALVFANVQSALYGVVALFCQMQVIDRIVYGVQKGRQILVVSQKTKDIASVIMTQKGRGVTYLHGSGAYSGKNVDVLMCVIRIWEYHDIKNVVYSIDPDAFVIVSEAQQIIGEGFGDKKT